MISRLGILTISLFVCAGVAAADDIATGDGSTYDDGIGDLPPAGLTGWFVNPEAPLPSPVEAVSGEPWTSPANIAILDYWLSVVAELEYDPSILDELYGLGMISSPDGAGLAAMQAEVANLMDEDADQQDPGGAPEPATLGFLIGGLVFLGICAAIRVWRIRRGLASHGPGSRGLPWKDGPP